MADLKSVAAVTTAVAAVASAPPVTAVEATIADAPDKLQQLQRQIQTSATITALPNDGTVTVQTNLGELTVVLPQLIEAEKQKLVQQLISLFQNDRPLTLVIQPGAPPTQSLLFVPNATGPTSSLAETALQPSLNLQSLSGTPPLLAVVLPPNVLAALPAAVASTAAAGLPGLASTTLPPGPTGVPSFPSATAPATAPVNTPVSLPGTLTPTTVLAADLPQNTAGQSAPSGTSQAVSQAANGATLSPTSLIAPGSLQAFLQPGQDVALTIAGTAASASDPSVAITGPNQIIATVIGKGPAGQLILQAGDATLYVRQPINFPLGTALLVTVDGAKSSGLTLLAPTDAGSLSILQALLSELTQLDPALAQRFSETTLPQPASQLPNGLLFFLSALKQGDTHGWLGPDVTDILLRAGKAELIARLSQELAPDGHIVRDAVVGDWRAYTVPLLAEGQLQSLYLYVHSDAQRQGSRDTVRVNPSQLRFLIDVRMTRLGPLQLDGLVQPKKLDMIIRSENSLPSRLPQELRDTFLSTLDALGYTGGLSFQNGRQNWLTMKMQGTSREV